MVDVEGDILFHVMRMEEDDLVKSLGGKTEMKYN